MKTLFLAFAATTMIWVDAPAQSVKNPPVRTKTAFEQKFPGALQVKWGKENSSEYEAEFVLGTTKMSANFTTDGKWLETESTIPVNQIPATVSSSIAKLFPDSTVLEADRIERAEKNILYEIVLKTGTKKKELLFDEKGVLQK